MLQVQNLTKTFNPNTINENTVFENFNLTVDEGDFITIIGSNGAGKSTLLNLISGMVKPDTGRIILKNTNLTKLPEYKCTKYIGRVFQDPSVGTSPSMTILENMSMAYNKGKKFDSSFGINKKNIPYFKELLSSIGLGLEDKLHTKVKLLSGGQKQSLALLIAVMSKPELLLLDEHTAALDPKTSERINTITQDIVDKEKTTSLMVTHNLTHAIKMGNRLIMMHQGKIIFDISGEEKKKLTIEKLLQKFENIKDDDLLSDRALFS
ncbi:MAG: ABC transporter ATP-binding protein [Clostridiaceae bacterium]